MNRAFKSSHFAKSRFQWQSLKDASYGGDEEVQFEGQPCLDDSSYETSAAGSTCSSRSSSGSGDMTPTFGDAVRQTSRAFSYRSPRRFSCYFTLAVTIALVMFILFLTQMSRISSRSVRLGILRPKPRPAPWEKFEFLERYYGGIRELTTRQANHPEYPGDGIEVLPANTTESPSPAAKHPARRDESTVPVGEMFDPYPDYSSNEYRSEYGSVQECFLDEEKTFRVPMLHAHPGLPRGFPDNVMGSYELFGLRDDVCFDRFGRLGPYGLGYSKKRGGSGAGMEGDREGIEGVWANDAKVDFRKIDWADVQRRCLEANDHRFNPKPKGRANVFQSMSLGARDEDTHLNIPEEISEVPGNAPGDDAHAPPANANTSSASEASEARRLPRTALILRTWWDFEYGQEDIMFMRALISELAIRSGGEVSVHILVHVKDDNMQIWSDDATYQRVLNESLPEEFRGLGTLWSERQMGLIYGGLAESFYRHLPVHGTYRSTFMPVQYFAHQHPEYDYFWHWEMDVRYTGHLYHLFDRVGRWAAAQPRKGLWERNARFYVPSEHGSWDDFRQMVRVQTEHGTSNKNNMWRKKLSPGSNVPDLTTPQQYAEKPIWGPEPPPDDELETDQDPKPVTSYKEDNYEWGVGEEADLITFNPMFDPDGTGWILAEDVTGYNTSRGLPPRRTAIITASRMSRRLLETMHRETAIKRHTMFSEMWPASCALHHGFKAVYAPHPVFIDRRWPTDYLASVMNGGRNGASGGSRTSAFSDDRQHNFLGVTWYYHAGFAPNLWKRWLGYRVDGNGGEESEVNGEGRMCLPAMLLHPVKRVNMIYEQEEQVEQAELDHP